MQAVIGRCSLVLCCLRDFKSTYNALQFVLYIVESFKNVWVRGSRILKPELLPCPRNRAGISESLGRLQNSSVTCLLNSTWCVSNYIIFLEFWISHEGSRSVEFVWRYVGRFLCWLIHHQYSQKKVLRCVDWSNDCKAYSSSMHG